LLELLIVVDGIERLFHHLFHDPGLDAASAGVDGGVNGFGLGQSEEG
jgi:hypothetical protein